MTTQPIEINWISLGEIIEAFAKIPRDRILPIGLHKPHSFRGDYADLAFEPAYDVSAGDVLDTLQSCIGQAFEGYKGGHYTMDENSWCFISEYGTSAGDRIGPILLHFLTSQAAEEPTP